TYLWKIAIPRRRLPTTCILASSTSHGLQKRRAAFRASKDKHDAGAAETARSIKLPIPPERHGILCATVAFFPPVPIAQNPNKRLKAHANKHKNTAWGLSNDNQRKIELGRSCAWNDGDVCVDRIGRLCPISSNSLAFLSLAEAPKLKSPSHWRPQRN